MRITASLPDHGAIVTAVMEGFVRAAQLEIEAGIVPPSPMLVANIRFIDEPAGSEDWQLPHQVVKSGGGDCEDLAFWVAGGMRATGQDPGASCVLLQTGPNKLHCVVQTSDGQLIDPTLDIKARHKAYRTKVSGPSVGDGVRIIDHRSDDLRKKAAQDNPNSIDAWMYQHGLRTFDSTKDVPVKQGVEYTQNMEAWLKQRGYVTPTVDSLVQRGVINPDKMVAYQAAKGKYGGADYASFGKSTQRLEWNDRAGAWQDAKTKQVVDPSEVPGSANLDILSALRAMGIDPSMLEAMGIDITQLQGMDPQTLAVYLQQMLGYGTYGGSPPDYSGAFPQFNPYGGYPNFIPTQGMMPPGYYDMDEVIDPNVFWSQASALGLDNQGAEDLGIDPNDVIDAEATEASE